MGHEVEHVIFAVDLSQEMGKWETKGGWCIMCMLELNCGN